MNGLSGGVPKYAKRPSQTPILPCNLKQQNTLWRNTPTLSNDWRIRKKPDFLGPKVGLAPVLRGLWISHSPPISCKINTAYPKETRGRSKQPRYVDRLLGLYGRQLL